MTKTRTEKIYIVLIAVVLVIIAAVLIFGLNGMKNNAASLPAGEEAPQEKEIIKEVEKIVEVEKVISAETIQEGLKDMGLMVTQQYFFTEVVSFSSVKKLFNTDIALKFTESSYLASYDGEVNAGLNFKQIRVEKDETSRTVNVFLPHSEILNVDIDPNSFELYSEKTGISNAISVQDFNQSLIELEETAKNKAIDRGILNAADQNARMIISGFIEGLVDTDEYTVHIMNV